MFIAVALLFLAGLMFSSGAAAQSKEVSANEGQTPPVELYVEVKTTPLRREPKHWSPATAALPFGEKLTVIQPGADWIKVKSSAGVEGFVHRTAVTSRVVMFRGSVNQDRVSGNEREIVLAGKGFSADVEALFGQKVTDADFRAVDKIESRSILPERLEAFMREGGFRQNLSERSGEHDA